MKLSIVLAATVAALVLTATASARPHHKKNWHDLTLVQKRVVVRHDIHVHRSAVQWWIRTRQRQPLAAAPYLRCRAIGIRAPGVICVHGQRLVDALKVKARIDAQIEAAEARARAARIAASYPPHHALWDCISGYEGGATSVNKNGHYGKLQMTYNWFKLIRGRASDYPEAVQEWAAEHAYMAQGSQSARIAFLYGQWFNYDGAAGACLKYA